MQGAEQLNISGYAVFRHFLSEDELSALRKDYERPDLKGGSGNYDVPRASASLAYQFEGKLNAVSQAVRAATGIDADRSTSATYFATMRGVAFPWHQDHETFFFFQQHRQHLNFYVPIIKPDPSLSNVCLIPFDQLQAKLPEAHDRLVGGGAKRFFSGRGKTDVYDDEYGEQFILPFDIESLAVTPELAPGDLLLLRGDLIHRTQDTATDRVAVSFRRTCSKIRISKARLLEGVVKREWMLRAGPVYLALLKHFDETGTDEISVDQLLAVAVSLDSGS